MNTVDMIEQRYVSRLRAFTAGVVLCLLCGFPGMTLADDTEVFFGNASSSGETRPNVMFVLDTSGSMRNTDGGSESRLERMKDAVRQMITSDLDMNIGLMNYSGQEGGGPVLYPITTLTQVVCDGTDGITDCSGPQELADNIYLVDGSYGDVEQNINTGGVNVTDPMTDLGYWSTVPVDIGLRYAGVNIARGATILGARLEFVSYGDRTGDSNLIIKMEDSADPVPFENTDNTVSSRSFHSTTKSWQPDDWFEQSVYQSPDISEMVQEIIDKNDWCTGNAMAFSITGSGNRSVYSYDSAMLENEDYIPKLRIIQDPSTVVEEDNCDDVNEVTLTKRISKNSDDAEQEADGGSVSLNGSDLEIKYRPNDSETVGLRFSGLDIPQGSVIKSAFLRVRSNGSDTGNLDVDIHVEDSVNPPTYSYNSNRIVPNHRDYLPSPVEWDIRSNWQDNDTLETPDLTALVQTLVSRSSWSQSSNAIGFWLKPTSGSDRGIKSYNNDSQKAPELVITYEGDPANPAIETFETRIDVSNSDAMHDSRDGSVDRNDDDLWLEKHSNGIRAVGLRFRRIEVPQGAVIESAIIRLESSDSDTGSISVDILAEDTVAAANYSNSNGPLSSARNYLGTPVEWNNLPNWSDHEIIYTPNLKSLVQTIVSKSNWDGSSIDDNAIGFLLKPTGGSKDRQFYSSDKSSSKSPRLIITYTASGSGSSTTTTTTAAIPANAGVSTVPVYGTVQAREEMLDVIDQLTATGYTPTVDAFYEAARYMRGEKVVYGKRRGKPDNPRREYFRLSHPDSYTGGTLIRDANCDESNLSSAVCQGEYISGNPEYISPMIGSCQANHIVLLSDGETNYNSSSAAIRSMIGKGSCTATSDSDEACATDLAEWLSTTDHSTGPTGLGDFQDIITHTIAFNLGGNGKAFLDRVAAAGGGTAHEADSAKELLDVFNDLVTTIVDIETGLTAPATTVNQFNRLNHRDDLYFALFKPEDSARWDGNIKRFRLGKDSNGGGDVMIRDVNGLPAINTSTGFFNDGSRSWWPEKTDEGLLLAEADGNMAARGGAANQLALDGISGIGERRVFTWLQDASSTISTPITLNTEGNKLHESNLSISDTTLGIAGLDLDANDMQIYKSQLLQWARGVDVLDSDKDGSTIDVRRSMGDPMHSRPVIVNYAPLTAGGEARSLLYVGTNEGFLHAIDTSNGQEQFAYIPYELLGNLNTFFDDETGFDRPYGLDGPLSVWRQDSNDNQMVDSNESVYLFAGMRRGGSSYYALDISDPKNPALVWTIKGGPGGTTGFQDMGQSWSRMTPVRMYIAGVEEDVLVFGGGYDVNQDRGHPASDRSHTSDSVGNGIYIVRATTGQLLWSGLGSIGGTEFFSDMEYGFNGNIRTIDINRDGFVDQMYAADVGGQLWRFDMKQFHSSSSQALVQGGVIADFSGSAEADHRRFYNEPDVALIEGGGERFLSVSIGSGWRAHPLDEVTQDRFYMVKQYAVYDKPDGYGKSVDANYVALTESDLINVTNSVNPEINQYGWYYDFGFTGEKVLGTSITFDNSVIFTSYVPTAQTAVCAAEIGSGRAYVMDVTSGAPAVDLEGNADAGSGTPADVLALTDRSTELSRSGIPPEAMIMLTEDSGDMPQILIGGEQLETGITNRTRRTFWSDEGVAGQIVVSENEDNDKTNNNQ
ncbi:MAG: PilC/PilY family type IV pilus protein [Granulosicoccus sp.]